MTKQYEVVVVTGIDVDVEAVNEAFHAIVSEYSGVAVEGMEQGESFGMTGKDAILSFVISTVAGFSVNMFQADIEEALSKAGHEIREQISVDEINPEEVKGGGAAHGCIKRDK